MHSIFSGNFNLLRQKNLKSSPVVCRQFPTILCRWSFISQERVKEMFLNKSCKAIPADSLRQFKLWEEKLPPLTVDISGDKAEAGGEKKKAFSYFYLHHDYTVSAGITAGEKVVFDHVTEEWKSFCTSTLQFPPVG
jgi:hypothetical protein